MVQSAETTHPSHVAFSLSGSWPAPQSGTREGMCAARSAGTGGRLVRKSACARRTGQTHARAHARRTQRARTHLHELLRGRPPGARDVSTAASERERLAPHLNESQGFWKRVAVLSAWCAGGASAHLTSVRFVTIVSPPAILALVLSPAALLSVLALLPAFIAFAISAGVRILGMVMPIGLVELCRTQWVFEGYAGAQAGTERV